MLNDANPDTVSAWLLCWLLTYGLHSTLFLSVAWVLTTGRIGKRWLGDRPGLMEALWKGALLSGVLTATLQLLGPLEPVAGTWTLSQAPVEATGLEPVITVAPTTDSIAGPVPSHASLEAQSTGSEAARSSGSALAIRNPDLLNGLLLVWLLSVLTSWLALARQGWLHRRQLRDRTPLNQGPLPELLAEICRDAQCRRRVRLSTSNRVTVPIALGLGQSEICVPPRVTEELSLDQQRTLLSHELAHLLRRDPWWQLTALLIAGLFPFQPLNRLAVRRLRQLSELLCDDWAVRQTDNANELARCLTEVAGWVVAKPRFFPSPGIAGHESELGQRVHRLLEPQRLQGNPSPRRLLIAGGFSLLLVTALAPGWSLTPSIEATPATPDEEEAREEEAREEAEDADTIDGTAPQRLERHPERSSDLDFPPSPPPYPSAAPPAPPRPAPSKPSFPDKTRRLAEPPAAPQPPEPHPPEPKPPQPAEPEVSSQPPEPQPPAVQPPDAEPPSEPVPAVPVKTPAVEPPASPAPAVDVVPPQPPQAPLEVEAAAAPAPPSIEPPVLVHRPKLRYPSMARRLNKSRATVEFDVTIDENGRVTRAEQIGPEYGYGFEREAIRATRDSVYRPARRDGIPIAFDTRVTIHFEHVR
ncbi:MAG: M56 family metallopeptidase [Acidobacteriota bacterium]